MVSDSPPPAERIERSDLDKHEFAQYILQEHGTYFPKWATATCRLSRKHSYFCRFSDMSVFVESPPNLKQRINQLQAQHSVELEKLYAHQAVRYLDDALDRYLAHDEEADSGSAKAVEVCLSPNFHCEQP
jgi:hypothetical protein